MDEEEGKLPAWGISDFLRLLQSAGDANEDLAQSAGDVIAIDAAKVALIVFEGEGDHVGDAVDVTVVAVNLVDGVFIDERNVHLVVLFDVEEGKGYAHEVRVDFLEGIIFALQAVFEG